MAEIHIWRAVALIACAGWAWTASQDPREAADCGDAPQATATDDRPGPRARRAPRRGPTALPTTSGPPTGVAEDGGGAVSVSEAAVAEAMDQLKAEADATREAQQSSREQQTVEQVWAFADAMALDDTQAEELEEVVLAMQDRLTELGPPDLNADADERAAYEEDFQQANQAYDADLAEVLGPERMQEFHDWMVRNLAGGPAGPPGADGGRPPGAPPPGGPAQPPGGAEGPPR